MLLKVSRSLHVKQVLELQSMPFTMLRPMDEKEYLQYTKQISCRKLMVFSLRYSSMHILSFALYLSIFIQLKLNFSFILQCCREVAEKYPEIVYEEVVIDNCCMMV